MAAFFSYDKPNFKIAGKQDVCCICREKLQDKEHLDIVGAERKLAGKLDNQQVFFLNVNGIHNIICENCINEIHKQYSEINNTEDNLNNK